MDRTKKIWGFQNPLFDKSNKKKRKDFIMSMWLLILAVLIIWLSIFYAKSVIDNKALDASLQKELQEKNSVIGDMQTIYWEYEIEQIQKAEDAFRKTLIRKAEVGYAQSQLDSQRLIKEEAIDLITNVPKHLEDSSVWVVEDLWNWHFDAYVEEYRK